MAADSAARVIELVAALPSGPGGDRRLLAMLREDAAHFAGCSAGEAERRRGAILAACEQRALSAAAFAALVEELRTTASPAVVAGAARALRHRAADDGELRALLAEALARVGGRDEYVDFGGREAPARTAAAEVAATLAGEGAPSSCCGTNDTSGAQAAAAGPLQLCPNALARVTVEDQFGRARDLAETLRARRSVVAFFYTRCMNPLKCSLTITRLARLAEAAAASGEERPQVLAISYDPDHDRPARLLAYGRERGFPFDDDKALLRCRTGWSVARRQFGLRVGYAAGTVNGHARELFLVTPGLLATPADPELLADPAALLGAW